jgi:hypothetical protein
MGNQIYFKIAGYVDLDVVIATSNQDGHQAKNKKKGG